MVTQTEENSTLATHTIYNFIDKKLQFTVNLIYFHNFLFQKMDLMILMSDLILTREATIYIHNAERLHSILQSTITCETVSGPEL